MMRPMRHIMLIAILLTLFGCKSREGQACETPADCAESLMCLDGVCLSQEGGNKRCSEGCRKDLDGACTAKDGKCIIASDQDCRASSGCLHEGRCSFAFGSCIIGKDADCADLKIDPVDCGVCLGGLWERDLPLWDARGRWHGG